MPKAFSPCLEKTTSDTRLELHYVSRDSARVTAKVAHALKCVINGIKYWFLRPDPMTRLLQPWLQHPDIIEHRKARLRQNIGTLLAQVFERSHERGKHGPLEASSICERAREQRLYDLLVLLWS